MNCRRLSNASLFAKLCKFEKTFKSLSQSLSQSLNDVNDLFKVHASDYAELKNLVETSVEAGNSSKTKKERHIVQSKRHVIPDKAPSSPVATWSLFDTICDNDSSDMFKSAGENVHIFNALDNGAALSTIPDQVVEVVENDARIGGLGLLSTLGPAVVNDAAVVSSSISY